MGVHRRGETQRGECLVKRGRHGRKVAESRGTPKISGTTVCWGHGEGVYLLSWRKLAQLTPSFRPLPPELRDNEFLLI